MCRRSLPTGRSLAAAIGLLVAHGILVGWIGYRNSPNPDEMAHLAAGLLALQHQRLDVYCVNPPLPRMLAALPVTMLEPHTDWGAFDPNPASRCEFELGSALCRANGLKTFWYFAVARWACLPFSMIGGYYCYRWALELYGPSAAALALLLWCFSPNVMAWSATICPDAAAASVGLASCQQFPLTQKMA